MSRSRTISRTKTKVQQLAAQSYDRFLSGVKERIRTAQIKAVLAANAELILHYWEIGRDILANQHRQGWGAKVIDRLSAGLQQAFPKLGGYSVRNLKYMRAFAKAWPDHSIVQQLAAQIPWMHNCLLLDRVKEESIRSFYIQNTIQHVWARSVLAAQIDTKLHARQGAGAYQLFSPPASAPVRSSSGNAEGSQHFPFRPVGSFLFNFDQGNAFLELRAG